MRPMTVVSVASSEVQSLREKTSGASTRSWGAPVLIVQMLEGTLPSHTCCVLFDKRQGYG